jgi:hypothetical protein
MDAAALGFAALQVAVFALGLAVGMNGGKR